MNLESLLQEHWQIHDPDGCVVAYADALLEEVYGGCLAPEEFVCTVLELAAESKHVQQCPDHSGQQLRSIAQEAQPACSTSTSTGLCGTTHDAVSTGGSTADVSWLAGMLSHVHVTGDTSRQDADPGSQQAAQVLEAPSKDVQALQTLTGGMLTVPFLQHVLQQHSGHVAVAAEWLTDQDDMQAQQDTWQLQQSATSQQQSPPDRSCKKRIVQQYAYVPCQERHTATCKRTQAAKLHLPQFAQSNNDTKSQVRFRDGMRVSSKGEKYIVEDAKKEWNGGVSGKVYTKGKRGKGFY